MTEIKKQRDFVFETEREYAKNFNDYKEKCNQGSYHDACHNAVQTGIIMMEKYEDYIKSNPNNNSFITQASENLRKIVEGLWIRLQMIRGEANPHTRLPTLEQEQKDLINATKREYDKMFHNNKEKCYQNDGNACQNAFQIGNIMLQKYEDYRVRSMRKSPKQNLSIINEAHENLNEHIQKIRQKIISKQHILTEIPSKNYWSCAIL